MANEIQISLTLTVTNGGYKANESESLSLTQSGIGAAGGVQVVGTSEENLGATDIGTNGLLFLKNLDSANFVDYGMSDSGTMKAVGRLKAGEVALLRVVPGVTVRAKADTASVKVKYLLLEN
jgi:hypothetical protein